MTPAPAYPVHSRFNRRMAVLTWALAALIVGSVLWSGDPRLAWAYPAGALIAFLAWSALWRPYVGVSADGVRLRNVTHSVQIPWAALVHIETRYALTLHTPGRRFVAWSAPAPGRLTSMRVSRNEVNREARLVDGDVRPSDMIGTDSGDAAAVVREHWEAGLRAGSIPVGVAEQTPVHRRPDVPVIAVTIALVTATVWALAATQ
ncbi:MAG: PH domain-containing protein [Microbacteriaceae bacterium]|nr:PH domain-containing protein [Microbacteriaceae bacterium]HOA86040.1 PH domain-containing protein [Microbacteriaceae bacterium]HPZ33656.1 PH domain-containing protein [Microbacteriaceae bacterium]HQC93373.1 PH domain-containing protein [Microbacteriaceae bacterium]